MLSAYILQLQISVIYDFIDLINEIYWPPRKRLALLII